MTPPINSVSVDDLAQEIRRIDGNNEKGAGELAERIMAFLAARRAANTPVSDDETYEIGKRDGYEEAVQDIDERTGGDGEYRFCTDHDPDRHTPDAPAMIERIVARFAIKPTSSILTEKRSIDADGNEVDVRTKGRHDPCVGIRAVPVGEAMLACILLDHILRDRGQNGRTR